MENKFQYDVFLAHNSKDKSLIELIAERLKEFDLVPWLDKEQIFGGDLVQDEIQKAVLQSRCAAFFVGFHGLGRWQAFELRSLITQCVERGIRVIPVLLPGVSEFPDRFLFLREHHWLRFVDDIDEEVLYRLVQSIKVDDEKRYEQIEQKDDFFQAEQELKRLFSEKKAVEFRLKRIQEEIDRIDSLLRQGDEPEDIRLLLDWLTDRENLARKYGKIALKKFENLKKEVEISEAGLEKFYLEVRSYLELIYFSVLKETTLFLDEPRLEPSLANDEIYESACFEVYIETFKVLQEMIPRSVEQQTKERVGTYFNYLAKRLLHI